MSLLQNLILFIVLLPVLFVIGNQKFDQVPPEHPEEIGQETEKPNHDLISVELAGSVLEQEIAVEGDEKGE